MTHVSKKMLGPLHVQMGLRTQYIHIFQSFISRDAGVVHKALTERGLTKPLFRGALHLREGICEALIQRGLHKVAAIQRAHTRGFVKPLYKGGLCTYREGFVKLLLDSYRHTCTHFDLFFLQI